MTADRPIVRAIELVRVSMPLVTPFRTSFGTQPDRHALLVRLVTDDVEGWGECVAGVDPLYSSEFVDGEAAVLQRWLAPPLLGQPLPVAEDLAGAWSPIKGHRTAKAALELAVLDAQLRLTDTSMAEAFGGTQQRVPVGVSVGIFDTREQLHAMVAQHLDEGYTRIKLKIEPGWDVDVVAGVRELVGDDVDLQVDANTAYDRDDVARLRALDEFDLLLLEQPLATDDLLGHARWAQQMTTPICLDESIKSVRVTADALELGACSIVNIKPGRVGGYLEARAIHDLCVQSGIPVWCGGMLETGIGRAANLALASLPGFTLPGDISSTARYFHRDITASFTAVDGFMEVPTGPGIGVVPDPAVLDDLGTSRQALQP